MLRAAPRLLAGASLSERMREVSAAPAPAPGDAAADRRLARRAGRRRRGRPVVPPWQRLPADAEARLTFLAEAEARFGPKERWAAEPDPAVRRTLLAVLLDAAAETRRIAGEAERRQASCFAASRRAHGDFAAWTVAVAADPALFASWPVPQPPARTSPAEAHGDADSADPPEAAGDAAEDAHPAATGGPSPLAPYEALPFLRQRAADSPDSLDPELRSFARDHLRPDEAGDAAPPPGAAAEPLAAPPVDGGEDGGVDFAAVAELAGDGEAEGRPVGGGGARRGASLKARLQAMQLHFDAEGAFFYVHRPRTDGTAPPPRMVRASVRPTEAAVVKVDWPTVRAASRGRGHDGMRARERLIRLCRGEDPDGL